MLRLEQRLATREVNLLHMRKQVFNLIPHLARVVQWAKNLTLTGRYSERDIIVIPGRAEFRAASSTPKVADIREANIDIRHVEFFNRTVILRFGYFGEMGQEFLRQPGALRRETRLLELIASGAGISRPVVQNIEPKFAHLFAVPEFDKRRIP